MELAGQVTSAVPHRALNSAVTRFWSLAAPAYDAQVLQRFVYRPAHDEVIAALRAHGARRMADVGCGTGILADRIQRELTPDEVFGVDMSEGMLAQANARSSRVWWMRGPAEKLPFADGSLDAVVSTSAFHFFDQPAALRDFHRVLAPGGLVAVATISVNHLEALDRLMPNRIAPAHSPSPTTMRKLFSDAGFEVSDQRPVGRPGWTRFVNDIITFGLR